MDPDDVTPVMVPNPFSDQDALLAQLSDLRKRLELWRPIVETAKIVIGIFHANGVGTPSFEHAIEMMSNMVDLAVKTEGETNG